MCEHTREHCSKLARDLLALVVLQHPFIISSVLQSTAANIEKIGLVGWPIAGICLTTNLINRFMSTRCLMRVMFLVTSCLITVMFMVTRYVCGHQVSHNSYVSQLCFPRYVHVHRSNTTRVMGDDQVRYAWQVHVISHAVLLVAGVSLPVQGSALNAVAAHPPRHRSAARVAPSVATRFPSEPSCTHHSGADELVILRTRHGPVPESRNAPHHGAATCPDVQRPPGGKDSY